MSDSRAQLDQSRGPLTPILRVTVHAPLRWAGIPAASLAAASLALVAWSFSWPVFWFLGSFIGGMTVAVVAAFVAPRFATEPPHMPRPGCAVDRAGIWGRQGVLLLATDDMLGVEVRASADGHRLCIHDRSLNTYGLRLHGEGAVTSFFERLGLDPRLGVVQFHSLPLVSMGEMLAALGLVMAAAFVTIAAWGPVVFPLLATMTFVALAATPSSVVVGRDGVHGRWLHRRVLFPIDRITRADAGAMGATLRMHEGRAHFLPMSSESARGFASRVNDALRVWSTALPSSLEQRLARGERTPEKWMADLRDLLRDASYRDAATSASTLAAVAGDVRQCAVDRVAAAIALAAREDMRPSIRELARSTADPELRRAFEQAARTEGVDATLIERLAAREGPLAAWT